MNILMKQAPALTIATILLGVSVLARAQQDWPYQATVAATELDFEMTDREVFDKLDSLKAQRANVLLVESVLADFLTETRSDSEMAFISRVTRISQPLGVRLLWYYPSLEVLSPIGTAARQETMFTQHPDWVQYDIAADYSSLDALSENVLEEDVAEPGITRIERSWMCHLSPYRDFYFARIQKFAAAGVDGIWVDKTLFSNDFDGIFMPCSNPFCRQKFETDTGFPFPTTADTASFSPGFRRWLIWRHTELSQFLVDIRNAARAVNPAIEIVVDVPTLDHNNTTAQALDLTYLGQVDGITAAWQIPLLSENNAMRNGLPDDWLSFIAMNKYGRGISGLERPGWVFTRGLDLNDAELVMAEGIASQLNPFHTGLLERTTINDSTRTTPQFRARMFSLVDDYRDAIFSSSSAARIALVYSSSSRDFADFREGLAAFVTTDPPNNDPTWWTVGNENDRLADGVLTTSYIAEYRGWVKALVENHVPFDIIPIQSVDAQLAQQYQVLIMPNPISLSNEKGLIIDNYVSGGGGILVTGSTPFLLNEFGIPFLNPLSAKLLAPNPTVLYSLPLLGKALLDTLDAQQAIQLLLNQVPASTKVITTDAPETIHLQLYKYGQKYLLHGTNFNALTGDFEPLPETFSVSLQLPETGTANDVTVVSPDEANNLGAVAFLSPSGGQVTFDMTVGLYSLAIVSFDNTPVAPFSPVQLPSTFAVSKSFPNPFQSSTTITVSLNRDTDFFVEIYNVLGQKIRTLANEPRRADTYAMIWDGKDDNGLAVATGTYFCRLRAGFQQHFMRLSIVR